MENIFIRHDMWLRAEGNHFHCLETAIYGNEMRETQIKANWNSDDFSAFYLHVKRSG
jgi:hypothetical protein